MSCVASFPGELNVFQRLMGCWNELHPYNSAHIYKLAGPAQPDRLRAAIREVNQRMQLGMTELSADGRRYRHETDLDPQVEVLPAGADPETRLAEVTAGGLNTPFARPRDRFVRWMVLDAGAEAHYLAAIYDHWATDSVAARLLLRHALGRYLGLGIPENNLPLDCYPPTYRQAYPGRWRGVRALGALCRLLWNWRRERRAVKPPFLSAAQFQLAFEIHRAPRGLPDRLRAFARPLGATVQDVFLAALSRAMAEHLPRRTLRSGAPLNIGTIIDTRRDAAVDLSASLGTFLSHYSALLRHDPDASLAELTRQAAAITRPIKKRRRYLDAVLGMRLATATLPLMSVPVRAAFMRRVAPYTAGVTNVVTHSSWIETHGAGRILDYYRAPPTGPMMPLVISPTSFRDTLNIGVSYRVTAFTSDKIAGIMRRFIKLLTTAE